MTVEKLYESDSFLVVNKPFDMYINSDDENEKNTVTCHIASPDSHLSTSSYPLHFVQRLDYSTSGVLCIAKTKGAAARAGRLFEKRETRKYYLAVVRGHVECEVADIEFDVGRRHQLRVHCSCIGHTILGDYTYSGRADHAPHRMFLHATRLVLPVPSEPLDIQTPEPFFQDPQFLAKWKSERQFYKYKTKKDLLDTCEILDKPYVIGVKYKMFSCAQTSTVGNV
ncbi:unnamed protein product [Chilo suppressalis]|uniref:Pseudouridine synthase RsuA/RluA-like domain-containing protein n=1 Tax=Chilo suppressalis TaxID=168631 RepID=A0ABN8L5K5_CHISP|nr:unnamed protein product [Chilo suppressalis]